MRAADEPGDSVLKVQARTLTYPLTNMPRHRRANCSCRTNSDGTRGHTLLRRERNCVRFLETQGEEGNVKIRKQYLRHFEEFRRVNGKFSDNLKLIQFKVNLKCINDPNWWDLP